MGLRKGRQRGVTIFVERFAMLQYEALLLGDKRLMNMTNIIGETLEDPWKLEGLTRLKLKKAATPMLYGSSATCTELWRSNGLKYDNKDIEVYGKEIANGAFGLANLFKEFIINNVKPKETMKVVINGETFKISCNRYRHVGEKADAYKIWDSVDGCYNIVIHTNTKDVPDLEQFRRYFVTLLIHNLDSQVADKVIGKVMNKYGWGIPIHDAFLVSPAAAADVRKWYAEELEEIYKNRVQIRTEFLKSIGITADHVSQWKAVTDKVVPFEGELKVNPMALK